MRLKLSLLLVFIVTYSWSQSGSTKTFTGNGTFPVPAGVTSIQVQAWGGGGSGGGASGAPLLLGRGAAGGGGGAYASNTILVTPGATLNVVVASQTPGTTSTGAAGGNSTITGFESSILAAGGSGGSANNAGGSPVGGAGGTTAASAGSIKFAGANGGNGNSWNLLGILLSSGAGGAGGGVGGAGGTAVSGLLLSNAPGNAGSPPGGAGSGAINSALGASQIGGAGAAGRVIISYSCANFSLTSTNATSICASAGTTSSVTISGSTASLPVGTYVVTYDRSSPSTTGLTANLTVSTAGTGTFIATGLTTVGSSTITITKLTSESCSSDITSNNTATATISAATVGGTVSGGTTINSGDTSGLLTLSGHTGSVIKWQSSVSPFTAWTDIANTTTTYTSGALTETTQFRAVVQNGVFCAALNSAATTVTVNPRPTITLAASATSVCASATVQYTDLSYTAITGSPTTYSIVWDASPANSFAAVTDAAIPASPFTIVIPAGTAAGTYTGTLTVKNASGSISTPGSSFTVTVNPLPTITLTESELNTCTFAGTGQLLGFPYSNTTGSPLTYSIVWNPSPGNTLQPVTDEELETGTIIIFVPLIGAGTYTGTLTVKNIAGCVSTGSAITINVKARTSISTTGTIDAVCESNTAQNATLTYTVTTNNPTSYSIEWDENTGFPEQEDSPFAFSPSGGIINTIEIPANTPAGTYEGTLFLSNGSCLEPQHISIVVNPSPTIALTQSEFNICSNNFNLSQTLEIPYDDTTESPNTYSVVWNPSPSNNLQDITDEELSESPISFSIPGLAAGTYTGTLTVKNANGCVSTGSVITLNVAPRPTLTTTGIIASVCASGNTQTTTLAYSASTNNPTSFSIEWDSETNPGPLDNSASTPFTFDPNGGVIDIIQISATSIPGTYHGTLTISDGNCERFIPISIVINPLPAVTFTNSTTINICYGKSIIYPLLFDELSGSPVTYSIIWNSSPANNLESVTDASLSEESIDLSISAGSTVGTYTGTLTVKNENGCISSGTVITVNVIENPEIGTLGIISSVDSSTTSQTASLPYTAVFGNPIKYSINWNSAANAALLTDQADTPFSFASGGGIINTIQIPANVPAGTYIGNMSVSNEFCSIIFQVTITINDPAPTIALDATAASRCYIGGGFVQTTTLNYGETTGNPTTYSIVWNSSPTNNFAPVTDASLPASPITIVIPDNTLPGTYTGTLTVKNANGVVSNLSSTFTVTIDILGLVSTNGQVSPVVSSSNSQITSLAYSGYNANFSAPTKYYIDWNEAANIALLADQPISPFAFNAGGGVINTIEIPANVPPGTYLGKMYITNETTCLQGQSISITVNSPAPTIALSQTAETRCSYTDGSSSSTTIDYTGTTGNPTTYSIVWDASPVNSFAAVTDAALPSSPITLVIPGGTAPGTYTGTLTVKNANGTVSSGSAFSLTLNETPTIDTEALIDGVNSSSSPQTTSLAYSGVTGNPISYFIDWNFDANEASLQDQPTTPFAFSSSGGIIDNIQISANVPAGNYIGTLFFYNGICNQNVRVFLKVNPVARPTIALASSAENVCSDLAYDQTSTTLSYTETTGEPVTYSIVWNSSPENTFAPVTDSVLPSSPITITIPEGTIEGTYTGTLTVKNANSVSSTGSIFNLTIGLTPEVIIYEPINPVCTSTNSQNAILPYYATESNPTSYYIDWDSTANASSLQDQSSTPVTLDHDGGTINTIVISEFAKPGSYSGTMYLVEGFCTGSHPVSIVINSSEDCSSPQSKGTLPEKNTASGITDLESAEKATSVTAFNQVINVETINQTINEVFVFDVSGNLLYKKNKVSDYKLTINSLRSSNQVLLVKVVLNDNSIITKKVVY